MDTQSRAYQITINNPAEHGFTDDRIEAIIAKSRVRFACYAHEVGENGTPHVHIYLCFKSPRPLPDQHRRSVSSVLFRR